MGLTFWDTADSYAGGQNEELIAKVLVPNRNKIFITTKFGFRYTAAKGAFAGPGSTVFDGSPAYLRGAVEQSLKRLRTEVIDRYYAHRIDPRVPVEDMVGAMADLVQQGKVRYLGPSEAPAASIRKAHTVHPIAAVQSEYSLLSRGIEAEVLPTLRELGISFVPFSPLARGLLTNTLQDTPLPAADFRQTLPRFQGEHLVNNEQLAAFAALAREKHCTPAQLVLA